MRKVTIKYESVTPISWSQWVDTTKRPGEKEDDVEARIWQLRFPATAKDELFIPQMAIKNSLVDAAQYRGEKIQGKGQKTWTEKFKAGVLPGGDMMLGKKRSDLVAEWLFVPGSPTKGKRGQGGRVRKCFPRLDKWSGTATLYIVDDTITKSTLQDHLDDTGNFIGMGRFRSINGGFYGKFEATILKIVEEKK